MAGPRARWRWLTLAAVAAIGAGVVVALVVSNGGGEQNDAPSPEATVGLESDVRFELLTGQCGFEVVVTAETTVDPEKGEFCLVRLDVRNKGDVPRSLDASCQYLIDAAGKRYRQRDDILPLDETTMELFTQEIAPGTEVQDAGLYYDVAKGTEAAEVELHGSCDSPGVRLHIQASSTSPAA